MPFAGMLEYPGMERNGTRMEPEVCVCVYVCMCVGGGGGGGGGGGTL